MARQMGSQPVLQRGGQMLQGAVWPGRPQQSVGQVQSLPQLPAAFAPGQDLQAELLQALQQGPGDGLVVGFGPGLALQHQGSQAHQPFTAHPPRFSVPDRLLQGFSFVLRQLTQQSIAQGNRQ